MSQRRLTITDYRLPVNEEEDEDENEDGLRMLSTKL